LEHSLGAAIFAVDKLMRCVLHIRVVVDLTSKNVTLWSRWVFFYLNIFDCYCFHYPYLTIGPLCHICNKLHVRKLIGGVSRFGFLGVFLKLFSVKLLYCVHKLLATGECLRLSCDIHRQFNQFMKPFPCISFLVTFSSDLQRQPNAASPTCAGISPSSVFVTQWMQEL